MKNLKFAFCFCLMVVALSSCSFYNPISTNVPSYEKTGEVNVGVNLGTSADIQVSTNPIEHLSIIGTASTSGTITNNRDDFDNSPDSLNFALTRYQFELGLGYYYMLTDKIQHDFHVGYGIGNAAKRNNLFSDESAFQADVNNFFIQSSLIIDLDDDVKGYISSKFNYLTISNYEQYFTEEYQFFSANPRQFRNESYWLNQFGLGIIADLGPLQLSAQGQLNFRFTNNLFVDERPLGLYVGVNFNISEIAKRIKEK